MLYLAAAIVLLPVLYFAAIAPGRSRASDLKPFCQRYIAHRGLFDHGSAPENSMAAFRKAIRSGFGIELDVRLTADDQLAVFHDPTLQRMCRMPQAVRGCTLTELQSCRLGNSEERIPVLPQVLQQIDGRVPLIVEIKADGPWRKTAKLAAQALHGYDGPVCIESFHPLILWWFRLHCPRMLRGQLSTDFTKDEIPRCAFLRFVLTNLLLNFLARPHFIAYNHLHRDQATYALVRRLFRTTHAAWTIRSQAQLDAARNDFQIMIFDSFLPEDSKESL